MTRYSVLLIAAALNLVAVTVAQARPVGAAATVTVTAGKPSEFKFVLSTKTVPHGTVTFKYTNKGALPHDFAICTKPTTKAANACASKGTAAISAGGSATLKFTFVKAGTYEYICKVTGHAAAGMKGLIKVT
jgi:plastocyanin